MNDVIYITAKMILDTALHIGANKGGEPTDAPLRRSGDGRLLVSGRALGGSLRTLGTRLAPRLGLSPCQTLRPPGQRSSGKPCGCTACRLFGDIYPVDPENAQASDPISEASRLWVYDATLAADTATYVRDGVGIDRVRGAASSQIKFDYEIIPAGTVLQLRLRLEEKEGVLAEELLLLLAAILAEWEAGRGQLGGDTARGLGRFHLEDIRWGRRPLVTADDLVAFLASDDPFDGLEVDEELSRSLLQKARQVIGDSHQAVTADMPVAASFVTAAFTLRFKDLFLSNDPLVALISGFDHAPLVEMVHSPDEGAGRPVLAGSSLRGVLRAHAEKVARTLATDRWLDDGPERFLEHCPACNVLQRHESLPLASCDARLTLPDSEETPADALCLICRLFGSQRRGSRLHVRDAVWLGPSPAEEGWKAQDFLAIDPFTGGGQNRAKFDAAPLKGASFRAEVTLHDPEPWELGCLLLVLRDLAEGHLTVGFGAAKGYGRVHTTEWQWTMGYLSAREADRLGVPPVEAIEDGLYRLVVGVPAQGEWLAPAWQKAGADWIESFYKAATEFTGGEQWQGYQDDSFLTADGTLVSLYGRARTEVSTHGKG